MSEVITLETCHRVSLFPTAPFHFDSTVHKPDYFPSSDNAYEESAYWQTMRFEGKVLGTKMTNAGTVEHPRIELDIFADEELSLDEIKRIAGEVVYRFDLDADLSDFFDRFASDDLLGPALARWEGMRVSNNCSLYEFLVIATVLQNATARRSVQMLENLLREYGSQVAFNGKTLSAFWPPEAIDQASEEELRALKVGYRAKHLKRQARPFVEGGLDEYHLRTLPSDELKNRLLSLYGIGPASVWYLMFGVFKRYDAFDHISPWEQKIYSRLLFGKELVDAEVILGEVDARWGEWKMLAAHYLWEDLFWQRKTGTSIPWLEELIRL